MALKKRSAKFAAATALTHSDSRFTSQMFTASAESEKTLKLILKLSCKLSLIFTGKPVQLESSPATNAASREIPDLEFTITFDGLTLTFPRRVSFAEKFFGIQLC